MVSRRVWLGIGGAVAVAIVVVGIGGAWALGALNRTSLAPPPTSPVRVTFTCNHTEGTFRAVATNVSEEKPFGDYQVSLLEIPTNARIVNKITTHESYIGGNGDVSLFYNDNDHDGALSIGDDFWVGSIRPGPYDVTLYWADNGAVVTVVRCS